MRLVLFVLFVAILLELYRIYDVDCVMQRIADVEQDVNILKEKYAAGCKQRERDFLEHRKMKHDLERMRENRP